MNHDEQEEEEEAMTRIKPCLEQALEVLMLKKRKLLFDFNNISGGSVSSASEHLPLPEVLLPVIVMIQKICDEGFEFSKIFLQVGGKGWHLLLQAPSGPSSCLLLLKALWLTTMADQ